MAWCSKPRNGAFPKIRSSAERLGILLILLGWVALTLACGGQAYLSSAELTATAARHSGAGGGSEITPPPPGLPGAPATPPAQAATPDEAPTLPPPTPTLSPISTEAGTPRPPILYYAQAGDTLPALAVRYGVAPEEITSPDPLDATGLITPGQLLIIPNRLDGLGPDQALLPDSEVVNSPSALGFDIEAFVKSAGGYLAAYREYLTDRTYTGAGVIERVAVENSVNPRLLLALVEYQSGWVYGQPDSLAKVDYPLGYVALERKGLYKQLTWAVQNLFIGYYRWREGRLTTLTFPDGSSLRLAPNLNAGSVALQVLFAQLYPYPRWQAVLYGDAGFPALYERMFGSPWLRARTVEPLIPPGTTQPDFILPFLPGHTWAYTGGPHSAWGPDSALAALDFAPSSTQSGCAPSEEWVTAVASGQVVRSEKGVVVLDLDGDGHEQTGWVVLYLHIASEGRPPVGTWLEQGALVGHPSCEGGSATGTHVHVARKYNGEWVLADGPLPFVLDGWRAQAGGAPYQGRLVKDDRVVEACTCASSATHITRPAR